MGRILSEVRSELITYPRNSQQTTIVKQPPPPPLPAKRPTLLHVRTFLPQPDTIHIPSSEYKELSILSINPFPLEGQHWWSVQHYFQAKKFRCAHVVDQILTTPSPKKAYQIGTDRENSHVSFILVSS